MVPLNIEKNAFNKDNGKVIFWRHNMQKIVYLHFLSFIIISQAAHCRTKVEKAK